MLEHDPRWGRCDRHVPDSQVTACDFHTFCRWIFPLMWCGTSLVHAHVVWHAVSLLLSWDAAHKLHLLGNSAVADREFIYTVIPCRVFLNHSRHGSTLRLGVSSQGYNLLQSSSISLLYILKSWISHPLVCVPYDIGNVGHYLVWSDRTLKSKSDASPGSSKAFDERRLWHLMYFIYSDGVQW